MRNRSARGFTLIELMIVVAIVAILAVIAVPIFSEQVRKSRRSQAMTNIQDIQMGLERWRVDHASFAGFAIPGGMDSDFYTFSIASADATSYTIEADPQGAQDGDRCGTLSLTNTAGTVTKLPGDAGCW